MSVKSKEISARAYNASMWRMTVKGLKSLRLKTSMRKHKWSNKQTIEDSKQSRRQYNMLIDLDNMLEEIDIVISFKESDL